MTGETKETASIQTEDSPESNTMMINVLFLVGVILLVIIAVVVLLVCRKSKKNKSQIEDIESIRSSAQTPDNPSSSPVRLEMPDQKITKTNNAGLATISAEHSNVDLAEEGMDETAE